MKKNSPAVMLFGITLCLIFLCLTSCATISLTGEWKDSTYNSGPFKKFIVIGIFKKLSVRQTMEDAARNELAKNGVQAISSLSVLNPNREIKKDDKEFDKFIHSLGVDGIIIIRLQGIDKSKKYVSGATYYGTGAGYPYGGAYTSYYYNYYYPVNTPGYYEDVVTVHLECVLFSNKTDKMVWKAEAESIPFDPSEKELTTPTQSAWELANIIVGEFRKNGYIPVPVKK